MDMKKYVVLACVGLAVILSGGALAVHGIHRKVQPITPQAAPIQAPATTYLAYQGQEGKTALELLETHASPQIKHDPKYGPMITGINGTMQGNGKYWTFYVNGKMANVGAGSYQTKTGDKIEWKLQ